MLASQIIPPEYQAWNRKWKAPFGVRHPLSRLLPRRLRPILNGYFSIQRNNSIRTYEYPWAFHVSKLSGGMNILDIGGGLGGFQFVLDKSGCSVTNVDPGPAHTQCKWRCDAPTMHRLNRLFGTSVNLQNTVLNDAVLPSGGYDRAFSISVMEHFNEHDIHCGMEKVFAALKPGGLFVLTVDLFLDIEPFTRNKTNIHGSNMNIRSMVRDSGFILEYGEPSLLYGFEKFVPENVLANLSTHLYGTVYPALAQCFILKKPEK